MREKAEFAGAEFSAPPGDGGFGGAPPRPRKPALPARNPESKPSTQNGIVKILGGVGAVLVLCVAGYVLARTFSHIHVADLGGAISATNIGQILAALLFTGLSYFALTGYDVVALRHTNARVPYRTTALASFASYAISFNLGFAVITAAAVRYWIYKRAGVSALQVANVTLAAGVTFWLGMTAALGCGLVFGGETLAAIDNLPSIVNSIFGALTLGAIAAYCIWVGIEPRRMFVRGHALELPGPVVTLAQVTLGVADLFSAAAALFVLLPAGHGLDFVSFVALYVFACILGVVSHAPGGIGVFEATLLHAVPAPSQEALLASLLVFRVVYYFLPLIFALALLGANEATRRWSRLKQAIMNLEARD